MIPKTIHTIWIQGYHLLPEEVQKKHLLVKKKNPDWDFQIWDNDSILKLLKKYPDIFSLYKKITDSLSLSPFISEKGKTEESTKIQSYLAKYVILKEYGGVYCDVNLKCLFDFNALFESENKGNGNDPEMYLVKTTHWLSDSFYYLYPFFNDQDIDTQLMAFSKDHPIWPIVFKKIATLRNSEQINTIFDHVITCHTEYSVNYLKKDGDCFLPVDYSVLDRFAWLHPYLQLFHCHYKQIYLVILLLIAVFWIHHISVFNGMMFPFPSAVPIPGVPPSQPEQPHTKRNTRQFRKLRP